MAIPSVQGPWPKVLWIVRHGQSAGNLARQRARAAGAEEIEIEGRDVDVPLSPTGEAQARALGRWLAALPSEDWPTGVLASPYVRATETARIAAEAWRPAPPLRVDERLRERDFGVLAHLTHRGIAARYPEEAEARRTVGKFYHRPPGGESWCDVIQRLRGVVEDLRWRSAGEGVLIVAHQVVVLCLRYILEEMSEAQILAIDREGDVAHCAVTQYRRDARAGRLVLARCNDGAPLSSSGAPAP